MLVICIFLKPSVCDLMCMQVGKRQTARRKACV
nr:MAG TPA: I2-superfamily conotoxin [Caudoviricetes sp.]